MKQILIIKHGALGDIILATGPMKAIRAAHPDAHITLLTAKPYDRLFAPCPFLNEIWTDEKPKLWQFKKIMALKTMLQSRKFEWVYDLQTSQRTTTYFPLLKTTYYSGLSPKGSHPHLTEERTRLHTIDRQKQQLEIAGIADVPPPDISWLAEHHPILEQANLRLVLMVPGGSAHRPEKRWPATHYAQLADLLMTQGVTPVLIGTKAEEDILQEIAGTNPAIINLCNQTSFAQIASIARAAHSAVGNDTGPMHIIAAAGCPATILFNENASNPDLCAPRGEKVIILKSADLTQLAVDFVMNTVITNP